MERKEAKKYVDAVFGVAWKALTKSGPRADLTWDSVFEAAADKPKSLDVDGTQLDLGLDMNNLDSITIDQTRNNFVFTFSRGDWGDGVPVVDIWVGDISIIGIQDNKALDAGFRKEIIEILQNIGSKKFKQD